MEMGEIEEGEDSDLASSIVDLVCLAKHAWDKKCRERRFTRMSYPICLVGL
jgi:hypothetical protein